MTSSDCSGLLSLVILLAALYSVVGVSMYITPSPMVVDPSSETAVLKLECSSVGTSNISGVYTLAILRRRSADIEYSRVAQLGVYGVKLDPNVPADLLAKSPNVTGGLEGTPSTSGRFILNMDSRGLTCNDQAEFKCELTYEDTRASGTATVSAHSYLTVIAVPKDAEITDAFYENGGNPTELNNDSGLNVDTRIMYKCTANIGSDPNVAIVWEKSSLIGTCTEFVTYNPVVSTDIVQGSVIQRNCTFSRTSSMYYNMTPFDDIGVAFRCKVRTFIGGQWYESISAHRKTYTVRSPTNVSSASTNSSVIGDGIFMYVTPSTIVVDSSSASAVQRLELTCSGGRTSNITGVLSLAISRRRFTEASYTVLAQIHAPEGSKLDQKIPADILAKSPNISGRLLGNPPLMGQLIISMDAGGLSCIDQAVFRCEMTYKALGASGTAIIYADNYLTVITVPTKIEITDAFYEKDGTLTQLTNTSVLHTGTKIMYKCAASIGNDPNVVIVWERSSLNGPATEFVAYTPTVSSDVVQDPVTQSNCSFSRTSSMNYRLTSSDAFTFRCKVQAYLDGKLYESISSHRRTQPVSVSKSASLATPITSITGLIIISLSIYRMYG